MRRPIISNSEWPTRTRLASASCTPPAAARALVDTIERGEHPTGPLPDARLAAALDVPLRDLIDPDAADRDIRRLLGSASN